MATYNELRSLFGDGDLQNKVEVAVCVKAAAIIGEESPTAVRLAWVDTALTNTASQAVKILKYLLAANKDAELSVIQKVGEAAIQAKVDAIIDKLHP